MVTRIKVGSQSVVIRGDHPGRFKGIAISYRSSSWPKHDGGEGVEKNKAISERKHVKSIVGPGRDFTTWCCVEKSRPREEIAAMRAEERIGKVEIARAKLLSRNGFPRNFRRHRCRGLFDFIGSQ